MKTIVTILGARPQFIKAKLISQELRKNFKEVIIHTGQHYDYDMSDVFFKDLELPDPDYNLHIRKTTHAEQTGSMMTGIEPILKAVKPCLVIVYGDTNSTLAGALTAAKLNIPVAHIEAGLRSNNMKMPEEVNRILTDHISTLLYVPTITAADNLRNEGLKPRLKGDVMYDMVKHYESRLTVMNETYYLATIHRVENTSNLRRMKAIFKALNELHETIIFPRHPRIDDINGAWGNIIFTEPLGYITMLDAIKNSKKVITDSGGVQKEAFILGKQCITVRKETEWTETLHNNWNILVEPEGIKEAIKTEPTGPRLGFYGPYTSVFQKRAAKLITYDIKYYIEYGE